MKMSRSSRVDASTVIMSISVLTLLSSIFWEEPLSKSLLSGSLTGFGQTAIVSSVFFSVLWLFKRYRKMSSAMHLTDTDASNWKYAAEGALNIALRYCGKLKSLRGTVLRLRKRPKPSRIKSSNRLSSDYDPSEDDNDPSFDDDLEETLSDANMFVERVMVPLLSTRYVPPSRVVRINTLFIDNLAKQIEPSRPEKRREAAALHRKAGVGLLMKDSAQIQCGCRKNCVAYCFELKPKWGFLTTEPTEWSVKRRVDRFTMHQHLKKKQSESVAEISEYCPLDLFKGGKDQIRSCLLNLEKTPQNNLRLFVNGVMKFPQKNSSTPVKLKQVLGSDTLRQELLETLADSLAKEDVLKRILKAQTIGPYNDIESVYPIYKELMDADVDIGNIHLGYATDYEPVVPPESLQDKIEIVKRFLISCTARDCSIMVAISSCARPRQRVHGRSVGGKWGYEITVVDLDAKPLSKMSHYFMVDREIAMNYTEKVEGLPVKSANRIPC